MRLNLMVFGLLMLSPLLVRSTNAKERRTAQWSNNAGGLIAFSPELKKRPYVTGSGVPLLDSGFALPVYAQNPPVRPYDVIGYVRMSSAPEDSQPRWHALQTAAACGQRHGGDALYLVEPRSGEYMKAAVLRWIP